MAIGKFDLIYNLDQKTTFLVYLESRKLWQKWNNIS